VAQNVITPEVKQRVAELVGLGCTYEEAGKAKGISLRSVERILSDPVYRRTADDAKRKRTSSGAQAAQVVRDLLGANKADGSPDMDTRRRGAELYAKNPELLESDEFEEDLLPGCAVFVRFPHAGYHGDGTPLPGKAAAELRAQHPKLAARMQARNTEVDEPRYITFSEDELAPVAP